MRKRPNYKLQRDSKPLAESQRTDLGPAPPTKKSLREISKAISTVVAIDFGTSETGVGWVHLNRDRDRVEIISPDFPIKSSSIRGKIPTAILLESVEPHKLIAFGKQAKDMWLNHDNRDSVLLFRGYKLALQCSDNSGNEPLCSAVGSGSRKVKASVVMQRTFEAIKIAVLHHLKVSDNTIDESKVLWVISKPCQWFDATTRIIRAAAKEIGMITVAQDQNLILCLEPEVVCIGWLKQCRDPRIAADETVIMVPDLGGGTVDVSVHLVMDRPQGLGLNPRMSHEWQLAEVISPAGDKCGSRAVDEQFELLIKELFERCNAPRAFAAFFESREMAKLLASWEERKEHFTFVDGDFIELYFCDVVSAIQQVRPELQTAALVAGCWNASAGMDQQRHLRADGPHCLRLSNSLVRSLFDPVLDRVMVLVEGRLRQANAALAGRGLRVNYVLPAGGFSACPLVRERMLANPDLAPLVRDIEAPNLAIVRGAAMLRIEDQVIGCRILQRTYGAEVVEDYSAASPVHQAILSRRPEAKRSVQIFDEAGNLTRTKEKIQGVFFELKKCGDPLSLLDRSPYIFNKEPDGENSVTIELFHLPDADGRGAMSVYDDGVRSFGKCTVRCDRFKSNEIRLSFGCGLQNVLVTIYNETLNVAGSFEPQGQGIAFKDA